MRVSLRVLCVAAFLAATFSVASAVNSCGIEHCSSCLANYCLWCEDGYYASFGKCEACTSNCRSCGVAGRCTSCMDGYQLSYWKDQNMSWDVITYGSCDTKGPASTCADPQCTSCIDGKCLFCANGSYLVNGTCVSCAASHCAHCEIAGRCLSCESGYNLAYVNTTESEVVINRWGTCVNGATFTNGYAALIGLAILAVTAMIA